VVPVPQHVDGPHTLVLSWGPWRRTVEVDLKREGLLLVTGKARDPGDVEVILHLSSDRPVYAVFGAGEMPEHKPQLDIRKGWLED
jgi:hypothetical protein